VDRQTRCSSLLDPSRVPRRSHPVLHR
jgi:hypothetical protein